MDENRNINIDLRKIFEMLRKRIAIILIVSLIGAIAAGCITNFFISPEYVSTVKLHVYSSNDNRIGANSTITSSEFDASQKLVNTYLVVVQSNTFAEKVADKLDGSVTADEIKKMMTCSAIEDTVAFQVRITSKDPQQSMDIANAIAETCPDEIVRILKVGGVEVIDYASLPEKPSSPNLRNNILIGLAFSFVVSLAYFFIREIFDTSITDATDLEGEFGIPVLGTVPRLVAVEDSDKENKTGVITPPDLSIDNFATENSKTKEDK